MREVSTEEGAREAAEWLEQRIGAVKSKLDASDGEYVHLYFDFPDGFPGEASLKARQSDSPDPEGEEGLLFVRTERLNEK